MFGNLIESTSHAKELKRKGTFMLGASVFYVVMLLIASVASIYAYDTRLDNQTYELLTLITPPETESPQPSRPIVRVQTTTAPVARTNTNPVIQPQSNATVTDPTLTPDRISTSQNNVPVILNLPPVGNSNVPFTGEGRSNIPVGIPQGNNAGDDNLNRSGSGRSNAQPPPPPPSRPNVIRTVSLGVINGRATYKPQPVYPQAARLARIQGVVSVQIVIDEVGRVVSAQATGGHAMLRQAAVDAARRARFSPTFLSNQPVRATGVITYNFILE
jgi:TonB family protein